MKAVLIKVKHEDLQHFYILLIQNTEKSMRKCMITNASSNFRYDPTAIITMGDMREFLNCTNIFPECLA